MGAGGHQHGDVAAGALKAALEAPLPAASTDLVQEVRARIASVHERLRVRAANDAAATGRPVMIASTIVVFLTDGVHFACLWCGDSRAYLLRGGALTQLSRDHTLVQEMVDDGLIAAAEADRHPRSNILTRAIGADGDTPELEKVIGVAEPGDRVLLCSDGLFKALDAARIMDLLRGEHPAADLIDQALAASARDNITAVVIEARAA